MIFLIVAYIVLHSSLYSSVLKLWFVPNGVCRSDPELPEIIYTGATDYECDDGDYDFSSITNPGAGMCITKTQSPCPVPSSILIIMFSHFFVFASCNTLNEQILI